MAESVRGIIMERGLFDPARSIGRSRTVVHFPVMIPRGMDSEWIGDILGDLSDFVEISGDTSLTEPRDVNRNPFTRIKGILEVHLTNEEMLRLPRKWEMIGDCLVLRLHDEIMGRKDLIAGAYSSVLGARYCILDTGGIGGEFRIPDIEVLLPPKEGGTEVVHREGGLSYMLDPTRIMFSSGNTDERRRSAGYLDHHPAIPGIDREDGSPDDRFEDVLDMFAGIGYFTIPIAGHPGCRSVTACEKNPVSFEYLKRNIELNGLTDKVKPVHGDNRKCLPDRFADRIVMGYVGGTVGYLDRALDYLKERGGIVHLHDTVKVEEGPDRLFDQCTGPASAHGFWAELLGSRRVKSFAPRIDHMILDIRFMIS